MTREEQWLLREKYQVGKSAPAFNESFEEIKRKYPWGAKFFTDCERLQAGEPLGYVIGYVPFLGCTIWLDSRPLIPRPETEWWVEQAIASIKRRASAKGLTAKGGPLLIATHDSQEQQRKGLSSSSLAVVQRRKGLRTLDSSERTRASSSLSPSLNVLDLCAGSGAIGVTVAKDVPEARVDFGEIDSAHHSTISKNLKENLPLQWKNGAIFEGDLWGALLSGHPPYDFILSNPPYIDPALDRTQASVKDFEPLVALYGGHKGLELIEQIIVGAPRHLTLHGQLWLEHEPEQSTAIQTLGTTHGFVTTTHLDQYGVERYSILVLQ